MEVTASTAVLILTWRTLRSSSQLDKVGERTVYLLDTYDCHPYDTPTRWPTMRPLDIMMHSNPVPDRVLFPLIIILSVSTGSQCRCIWFDLGGRQCCHGAGDTSHRYEAQKALPACMRAVP